MIPNKKLLERQVDRDAEKKRPKEVETAEEFLKRGGKIKPCKDKNY